jgi:hypothetical protein
MLSLENSRWGRPQLDFHIGSKYQNGNLGVDEFHIGSEEIERFTELKGSAFNYFCFPNSNQAHQK